MAEDKTKDIQIAKINARQTMVVALISAMTGIVIALLGTDFFSTKNTDTKVEQSWLTIVSVKLERPSEFHFGTIKGVRIISEVNGNGISYPTRALWAEPNPEMSPEKFVIEDSQEYKVRFEVLAIGSDDEGLSQKYLARFISQKIDMIKVNQLPFEGVYELYEVGTDGFRGGAVTGYVKYKITKPQ